MDTLGARPSLVQILPVLLALVYPLVVYLTHGTLETRALAGLLLLIYASMFLVRIMRRGGTGQLASLVANYLPLAALAGLAIVLDDPVFLLSLPALISAYVCATFAQTLWRSPSMIQRIAEVMEDDLPPFTHAYCRKVTWVWCAFMASNALFTALLALRAPLEWWALHTGVMFYLLLGALLLGEFVIRKVWFRYYPGSFSDRVFARWFPAEATANGRRSLAYAAARRERVQSEASASPQ